MKFSTNIQKCNLSPIRKFYPYQVECQKKGKKIYHLNIGQPDIKTPEAFFDAVKNFSEPVLAYAPSPGIPLLIKAVQDYYKGIGIEYATDEIVITTGGSEAVWFTMMTILSPGDEILIPEPFYPNYNTFVKTTGATIVPIPTTAEEGYRFADREKIEKLITPKTKAIMFTNPGNPTGVVLKPEETRLLADIAKEHGLFLVADEVYREFVYGGEKLFSMGQYEDVSENVIIVDSVSKRFSACGARIGSVLSKNKEFHQEFMKLCQARLSVPTLDQIASAALYNLDGSYFDEVRAEYKRRKEVIYEELMKIPGIVCSQPEGAFYVMVKLPVDNAEDFLVWLLTEFDDNGETVMYAPGEGFFATPGKGVSEIRMAYVLNCDDLRRAIQILGKGIEKYNSR